MNLRLLFPFLLLNVCGFSQPILTFDQIPGVGSSFEYYVQNEGAFPQFIAGPDQVWTFPEIEYDRIEKVEYLSPTEFPQSSEMGNINLVLRTTSLADFIDSSLTFNRLSEEGLYEYGLGFQTQIFAPEIYGQPYKRLNLPLTYEGDFESSTFINNALYYGADGIDSILTISNFTTSSSLDGYGSITIENVPYSVLKNTSIEIRKDSIFYMLEEFPGEFQLQFTNTSIRQKTELISADFGIVVYSVTEEEGDKGQTIYQHRYLRSGNILNNSESAKINELELFPNPANSIVNISVPNLENQILRIVDISGKLVKSINSNNQTAVSIDISDLARGMYFVNVSNREGKNVATKKLIIK
ncbi:MAG: T9SS type A sorting domain-containing protein [Bacteroidia bacterium]